jgi:hypothetical protein
LTEALTTSDVDLYTDGRLPQDHPETQRALDAALARARRYCGWHVTPAIRESITLDYFRSNPHVLEIPTLKIVSLESITVDGEPVDLSDVQQVAPGLLTRKRCWADGETVVELTHGYSAAEAQDWREAVLAMIDTASQSIGTGGAGALTSKTVDNVTYSWSSAQIGATALDLYKILPFA